MKLENPRLFIQPLDDAGKPTGIARELEGIISLNLEAVIDASERVVESFKPLVAHFNLVIDGFSELWKILTGYYDNYIEDWVVDNMGIARSDIRKIEDGVVYLYNWRKILIPDWAP